ncbi:hypothetical protein LOAG_10105 [Loa loa]|uniref:Uncharacterized protein n=1 Tax=Loa loa TaxID=7209 RepID=A0A1I7VP84_LOALO|nr:hypothetical protein LOAG_10105 [Loa loa]EFO18392.1 hypothetical protein LOAG_10105 [Loa loa]
MRPKVNGLVPTEPKQKREVNNSIGTKPEQCYANKSSSNGRAKESSKSNISKHPISFAISFKETDKLLLAKNVQEALDVVPTLSEEEPVQIKITLDENPAVVDRPQVLLEKNKNDKAKINELDNNHSTSKVNRSETGKECGSSL